MCDRRVAHREPERDHERVADEERDVRDGRRDEHVPEQLLAVEEVADTSPGPVYPERACSSGFGHIKEGTGSRRLHLIVRAAKVIRGVAQLAARSVRDAEAVSSSLTTPTSRGSI